jgi:hypothetical protein
VARSPGKMTEEIVRDVDFPSHPKDHARYPTYRAVLVVAKVVKSALKVGNHRPHTREVSKRPMDDVGDAVGIHLKRVTGGQGFFPAPLGSGLRRKDMSAGSAITFGLPLMCLQHHSSQRTAFPGTLLILRTSTR